MMPQTTNPLQRIAMLSVHTSPLAALGGQKTGGMNVYVRDFSRALAASGVEIDIFTRADDPGLPDILDDTVSGCRVIHVEAGPVHLLSTDNTALYLDKFTQGVLNFAHAHNQRYDLIHSHYWLSGIAAIELRDEWHGTPVVHMYHTLGHMKNRIARHPSEFASKDRLAGEYYVAHHADRLIAATPPEEEQLVEFYHAAQNKISVIPPGVDLARFQPLPQGNAKQAIGLSPRCRMILFVGRIEPLKGIDTLLCAVSLLRDCQPALVENVHVAIIGGDPHAEELDHEMERLQHIHRSLDLHKLVTFLGARDQEILPQYYAASDMVVIPSHYESFGMVGLEAMAMGVPVIASSVGGLAHLVQDGINGYLVPARTPEALAERIFHLLSDEPHRQQLSQQAHTYARDFGWPKIVDQMMAVYGELGMKNEE
jgi:D-inositol-3-phosphate glycosyltransferase